MEKSISYLSKDFNTIKSDLIKLSKNYYPTLTTTFSDNSVGEWFIDMVSAVGDDLFYSIDRAYQENNIDSMRTKKSVMNYARLNNVKIPGPKCSMVEVEISCLVGVDNNQPDWNDAPIVKRETQVGTGTYVFELCEDVDFREQFNENGYSNRKFEPNRNSNGAVTSYTVSKSVMAIAGTSKIYKQIITHNELKPFMEIVLPDLNVTNVESIIFKSEDNLRYNPKSYEYYVELEEFQISGEFAKTYHFFEVDSLSDLYRFGGETILTLDGMVNGKPTMYHNDYTEPYRGDKDEEVYGDISLRTSRIYKGKWTPITQKYITEYTDNGYMKITFGSGSYDKVPEASTYAQYVMSNVVNNQMLGVLPQEGWTMYVRYRVANGAETNIAIGAINTFIFQSVNFPNETPNKETVLKTLRVTNLSNAIGGKDAPSTDEMKHIIKYSIGSQNRCLTVNDYKARVAMMPPKYGCPFRHNAVEENNKIVMPFLGLTPNGKLDSSLPSLLVDNVKEYLSAYKGINDYIEMKSGKIYNLGFEVEVYVDKNYTAEYVIKTVINTIKDYMDIHKHMIGDSVFIGDLEKEINKIDGVIAIINLNVYNIYNGKNGSRYYGENAKFPIISDSERFIGDNNATYDKIDLDALDRKLENDYDSMFEILNPEKDIAVRCKVI